MKLGKPHILKRSESTAGAPQCGRSERLNHVVAPVHLSLSDEGLGPVRFAEGAVPAKMFICRSLVQ